MSGSYKTTTKSSSSGSSMSIIIGFKRSLENFSFGVLYAMSKGNTFPRILTILSILIEFCQLSSFGFKSQYKWGGSAGYYLQKIMSPINSPSEIFGYTGFTVLFWIVVGLLCSGFFNIWYVAYKFYRGKIANIWVIRTLRWFVSFSVAVLFIPIVSLLLVGLDCQYVDGKSTLRKFENEFIDCFRGSNLPIAVCSIMLILLFALVAFCSSATYYEYDTNIKSRFAKPHARFDLLILISKLILSILNSVVEFIPWLTSIVYFILMLVLVAGSIFILPYNNQRLNQVKSGFYMTVLWVSFVTMITMAINDRHSPASSYLVVAGIFPSFPIGYFLNRFYYKWLTSKIKGMRDGTSTPTSVSLNESISAIGNGDNDDKPRRNSIDKIDKDSAPISNTGKVKWGKEPITLGSKRQIVFPFFAKRLVFSFFVEIMARKILVECNEGMTTSTPESIERANNLYQCGLQYFPNSDLLWMAYCNYLFTVRKDRHIGYAALEKLRRMKPSFDVRFFIYQRDKEREQIMDSDLRGPEHIGKIQDFVSYMEFKKLYFGAKRYHVKCLTYIKKFWSLLLHETVDLHRLSDLSGRIATTENKANESYERLLALNPNSVRVLRDYSQFLEEVVKDKESAYRLQKKAEAIEDIMSKGQTFDFKINGRNLDLEQQPNSILNQLANIDSNGNGNGEGNLDKSLLNGSKSKDSESDSTSSSSKGRRRKYKEFQQSNAISKLSWSMIGTTLCCIIFLIVILVVFRGLEVKHINSYQGILSITDCASEALTISITLNTMQSIATNTLYTDDEKQILINPLREKNKRSINIMSNIHSSIYWGESEINSYVGDNLSILKSRHGYDIFDIGNQLFSYGDFNRSNGAILSSKELVRLYNEPSTNMTYLISSTGGDNSQESGIHFTQSYNAWKAGNTFIECAKNANNLTLSELMVSRYNSDFKFVILNAPTNIPKMYISIQKAYIDALLDDVMNILNSMWYVWLGIFGFLCLIAIVLFRPTVSKISREKIRTLVLFSLAPKDVVVKLSTKKIKMVSLDSGSERENLFDTTDDDDSSGVGLHNKNHHLTQIDSGSDTRGGSVKNSSLNEDGEISICMSDRRPLVDTSSILASTSGSGSDGDVNPLNESTLVRPKSNQDDTNTVTSTTLNQTPTNSGMLSNRSNKQIKQTKEEQQQEKDKRACEFEDERIKVQSNSRYGWDGGKRNLNKKSLRSVLRRLHLSYTLAITLLFGFISMGLWVSYYVVYDNSLSGYVLGQTCKRSLDSRVVNYYVVDIYTFDDVVHKHEVMDALLDLQINHQSIPYLEDVRSLMDGTDGCWALDESTCIQQDSIYYRDASHGVDWVIDQYVKHVVDIIHTNTSHLLNSTGYQWIKAVGTDLVFQGLDKASFIYWQYYLGLQQWATNILTAILAVSCVILVIVYIVLFRPFMNHLRIQHIHTLALIRLAPDDIKHLEVSDKVIDED